MYQIMSAIRRRLNRQRKRREGWVLHYRLELHRGERRYAQHRRFWFTADDGLDASLFALRHIQRVSRRLLLWELHGVTLDPDLSPIPAEKMFRLKFHFERRRNRKQLFTVKDPAECFVEGYGSRQAAALSS